MIGTLTRMPFSRDNSQGWDAWSDFCGALANGPKEAIALQATRVPDYGGRIQYVGAPQSASFSTNPCGSFADFRLTDAQAHITIGRLNAGLEREEPMFFITIEYFPPDEGKAHIEFGRVLSTLVYDYDLRFPMASTKFLEHFGRMTAALALTYNTLDFVR